MSENIEEKIDKHGYSASNIQVLEGLETVRKNLQCTLVILVSEDYIT